MKTYIARQRHLVVHLLILFGLLAAGLPAAQAGEIDTRLVVDGLTAPIDIKDLPDQSGRRLVLDQSGLIHLLNADDSLADQPFLDIRDRLLPLRQDFEERGLLGLAIHPDYLQNGRVFVTYSAPLADGAPGGWNHSRRVSEFTLARDRNDKLDPRSERVLIEQHWPSRKHNGGALGFGPDRLLYIGFGDGGGIHGVGAETLYDAFSVPARNRHWDYLAQDKHSLFGKILRIDVDNGYPGYASPAANPWVGKPGRDEIFAWGFRNPYRFSFAGSDPVTLYLAAVAETFWESVYRVDQSGNYGWPIKEGTHCFDRAVTLAPPRECEAAQQAANGRIIDPVIEYPNMSVFRQGAQVKSRGVGTAVVGAIQLANSKLKDLDGKLLVADWSLKFDKPSGQLFTAVPGTVIPWPLTKVAELTTRIVSIAQTKDGRVFVLTNQNFGPYGKTGTVLELIVPAPG